MSLIMPLARFLPIPETQCWQQNLVADAADTLCQAENLYADFADCLTADSLCRYCLPAADFGADAANILC